MRPTTELRGCGVHSSPPPDLAQGVLREAQIKTRFPGIDKSRSTLPGKQVRSRGAVGRPVGRSGPCAGMYIRPRRAYGSRGLRTSESSSSVCVPITIMQPPPSYRLTFMTSAERRRGSLQWASCSVSCPPRSLQPSYLGYRPSLRFRRLHQLGLGLAG